MPELKASPRNRALGLLADALSGAKSAADTVQLPVVGGLGGLLFGDAPELVNDAAYYGPQALVRGGNAATGGIGTFAPDRRILDAAGVVPMAPGAARAVKTIANPATYRDAFFQAQAPAVMSKIFIGEKAKTWDKGAAEAFKKLEAQGVGNKEAWQQTGTFRSPDGKLRQEIDDSAMTVDWKKPSDLQIEMMFTPHYMKTPDTMQTWDKPLSDLASSTDVMKAYPDLENLPVNYAPLATTEANSAAYIAPIKERTSFHERERIETPKNKSHLLHELQHAVQMREGVIPSKLNSGLYDYDSYWRQAHEAEARAVQARMNMTPEQRRLSFPLDSYDVPINELIIRSLLD